MIRRNYANVMATIAFVMALTTAGATAAPKLHDLLITNTKQIKNGVIKTQDIAKGGVKSTDLATGAVKSPDLATNSVQSTDLAPNSVQSGDVADGTVQSPDIATGGVGSSDIQDGSVTPTDVTLPEPVALAEQGVATAEVGEEFALVDPVGTFDKVDGESAVSVTWTGSAAAGFSPCIFQLRVNGQPAGSQVYVSGGAQSVAATALFEGLPAGQHQLDVYARTTVGGGAIYPCTVGPASIGIPQSFVIEEVTS